MIQNILVLIIISTAIIYTIFSVVKNIRKKETSPCGGCNGCDIKKEINKNTKLLHTKEPTTCGYSSK